MSCALKDSVDREKYDAFRFPILAVDQGTPPRTGSALVIITVLDVNDERPQFLEARYRFNISENEGAGTRVGSVAAEDADAEPNNGVEYALVGGKVGGGGGGKEGEMGELFAVDAQSGAITTRRPLDREEKEVYQVDIV